MLEEQIGTVGRFTLSPRRWLGPVPRRSGAPGRPGRGHRALALAAALLLLVPALACQRSVGERLEEVRSLHELGSWEDSIEDLRAILDERPEHAEANYRLGLAQLRLGQPSLAIWPLQMASRDPDFAVRADVQLAIAYLQLDQLQAAIDAAGRVLDADAAESGHRRAALEVRARAHMQRDEPEEALEHAERMAELRPDDPTALTLRAEALLEAGRPEDAEATLREMWEAGPDEVATGVSVRAGLALVSLYREELEQPEAAERQLQAVLERHPGNAQAVRTAVSFYEEREERASARAVLEKAVEAQPAVLDLRTTAAQKLSEWGEVEEGEAILEEGTEILGSPAAWLALERYRLQHGDTAGALEAVERTLELVPEPTDMLRFKHADLLITDGALERAEGIAEELGDSVYGDVLRGRLDFVRGRYAEALEHLDAGLRRWPNNPGARQIAGKAAFALGDVERALSDLREAVRATTGNSDAGLDLARIHLARGNPQQAFSFAAQTLGGSRGPGGSPERVREASLLAIRALTEQGRLKAARGLAARLATLPEGERPAALALARIAEHAQGPAAAAEALEESELDLESPENLELLRALGQYRAEAGQTEQALARVEAALEAHPDVGALHDVRGRLLMRAGRAEEAREAFERALEIDPEHAPALAGRARLAEAAGEPERARELMRRAAEADPTSPEYPYAAAQIALASGETAAAEERLRAVLRRDPTHPQASNDLAWILAERGEELDEALALARRAKAGRPTANVLDTLGWVQLQRGEPEAAVETLTRARELDADSPSIAYRLALALAETGEKERARALLEEALASGRFPEAESAREQLARLDSSPS